MFNQSRYIVAIAGICALVTAATVIVHRGDHRSPVQPPQQSAHLTAEQAAAEQETARLAQAAGAAPNDSQKQLELAGYYMQHDMYIKAADQLAIVVKLNPNDLSSKLKLGDLCLMLKNYPSAESNYRAVTLNSPQNPLGWQGLCAALIKQRRFFEATNAGKRALDLGKNDTSSRILHSTALLNFALQFSNPQGHIGEIKTAQADFINLTANMPDSGELFYELGLAEQALRHRDASTRNLERAHLLMPGNGDAAQGLALSYHEMNRDDKALQLMEEMAEKLPNSAPVNDMLGQLLLGSSVADAPLRALAAFKMALRTAPNDSGVTERLGSAYEKLNDLPNARLAYERATQLNPNGAVAFHKLALVYTRLQEPNLAKQAADYAKKMAFNEQQLKTIVELSSRHPEDVNLHLIIADRYRDMKMEAAAREEYFVVLSLDPHNERVPKELRSARPTGN